MELQTGAAKEVVKPSRTKELQTGVVKGIANLGCKEEGAGTRSWKQKLQKGIAIYSRKRTTKKPRTTTKQEMQKRVDFEVSGSDCLWQPCYGDLQFSSFLAETSF